MMCSLPNDFDATRARGSVGEGVIKSHPNCRTGSTWGVPEEQCPGCTASGIRDLRPSSSGDMVLP